MSENNAGGPKSVYPPDLSALSILELTDLVEESKISPCMCGLVWWTDQLDHGRCPDCGLRTYVYGRNEVIDTGALVDFTVLDDSDEARDVDAELDAELDAMGILPPKLNARLPKVELDSDPKHQPVPKDEDYRPPNELSRAITSLRENLDMTQAELASALGVHKNTIYRLETGQSIKLKTNTRLALIAAAREAGRMELSRVFRLWKEGKQL